MIKKHSIHFISLLFILLNILTVQAESSSPNGKRINDLLEKGSSVQSANPQGAIQLFREAQNLAKSSKEDSLYCYSTYQLAVAYRIKGELDSAVSCFNSFFEDCGTTYPELYAYAKVRMSRAYGRTANYDKAKETLEEIEDLVIELDNHNLFFEYYTAFSSYYHLNREFDSMKISSYAALKYALLSQDSGKIGTAYSTLGVCFTEKQEFDSSLVYNLKSLELARASYDSSKLMYAAMNIGALYRNIELFDSSLFYLNMAKEISLLIDNMDIRLAAGYNLAYLYSDIENHKSAFDELMSVSTYHVKKIDKTHISALNEMEVKYESSKKESKIKELRSQNEVEVLRRNIGIAVAIFLIFISLLAVYTIRLRNQTNKKLKVINENKTNFFAIVSHDLKNLIASFHGMGEISKHYVEEKQFDKFNQITQMLDTTSIRLNSFLDNLLKWSINELDRTPYSPENLKIDGVIEDLFSLLKPLSEQQNVSLTMNGSNAVVFADRYGIELILRNLIGNALKYSPKGTEVLISSSTNKNESNIKIQNKLNSENSNAINELKNQLKDSTVNKGMSRSGGGMGLYLVNEFININKGQIKLETEEDLVTFTVILPNSRA